MPSPDLRPEIGTGPVLAGLQRFADRQAFTEAAQADLTAAEESLRLAVAAGDHEATTAASVRVGDARRVVEACGPLQIDPDTLGAMRQAVASLTVRYAPEIGLPHRGEHIEARVRFSQRYAIWARAWTRWHPTGTPPEAGIRLLREASALADEMDVLAPVLFEPRQEDALVRATPRPRLDFIDLSTR